MKRQRRKETPCILCSEPTRDWDHICTDCRDLYNRGRLYSESERRLPEGTVEIDLRGDRFLYHGNGNPDNKNARKELLHILSELLLAARPAVNDAYFITTTRRTLDARYAILARGNKSTQANIDALLNAVEDLMAISYESGLRRGKAFIRDLADGNLTVKDLESL